jgi:hypothetical protein
VDLAVAFDDQKRLELGEKLKKFAVEEQEILEKRKDYHGNRYDIDVKVKEGDN